MIRSVAPFDLWGLRRKPHSQVVLYNELLLVQPHHPFWFALRCLLQGTGRERETMVYRDHGVCASAQARSNGDRPEQSIIYLSSQGSDGSVARTPGDYDVWFRLLERLCIKAGHNYVQRLYTAVGSQQVEIREIFRQLGFQAYTSHMLLQLQWSGSPRDVGTTSLPMRPQSRHDAWAIHKLYSAVTPPLVQQAESRSSRNWVLPLSNRWSRRRSWGWVLGPDDDLRAYLRILSGPLSHVLTLLVHPGVRELVPDIVRFGLSHLHDARPVYLLLRDYHQDLLTPVQQLGFQPVGEQVLLVKNTVVPVRRSLELPALKAGIWDTQVPIPRISIPREDSQPYVRTTRCHK